MAEMIPTYIYIVYWLLNLAAFGLIGWGLGKLTVFVVEKTHFYQGLGALALLVDILIIVGLLSVADLRLYPWDTQVMSAVLFSALAMILAIKKDKYWKS